MSARETTAGIRRIGSDLIFRVPLGRGYWLAFTVGLTGSWDWNCVFHTWGREMLRRFVGEPHVCYGQLNAHLLTPLFWVDADIYHVSTREGVRAT